MNYILTLENIQDNENLQEAAAMPGDEITEENVLKRVFSTEEDSLETGYKIKQEDINSTLNLQKIGAKVDDRIVDGVLKPLNDDSVYKQLMYGGSEGQGMIAMGTDLLSAQAPDYLPSWLNTIMEGRYSVDFDNGFQYQSPEEVYGVGFNQANPEQRREMIERARERGIVEEYGQFFQPDPDSWARTIGNIGGMITDPTTFIAPGASAVKVGLTSSALGGTYSLLEDMTTTGEIDIDKALMYGAFSGFTGVAAYGAIKAIGGKITKSKNKSAEKVVKNAEDKLKQLHGEGFSANESFEILPSLVNNKQLTKAIKQLKRPISIPPQASQAAKSVKDSIVNDISTAGSKPGIIGQALGVVSTRVSEISPAMLGKLRQYYFKVNRTTGKAVDKVKPFIDDLRALKNNPDLKIAISRNLYNGKFDEATRLMPETMRNNFNAVKDVLKVVYNDSQKAGIYFDELGNYFPRQIKDLKAFRKSLGTDGVTSLVKLEQEFAKKLGLNSPNDLSMGQRAYIANQYARGFALTNDKIPKFAKSRKIDELTDEQITKFYQDPADALSLYLRNSISSIEKYKFFGKNALKNKDGIFNIDESIGKVIQQERINGRLNPLDEDELVEILQSLFTNAEKPAYAAVSHFRNLAYLGTIGNPYASVTQLADLAQSGFFHGFKNTIVSVVRNIIPEKTPLIGKKQLTLVDVGINNIAQELAEGDAKITAKALNSTFDLVGFRRLDRLGKESTINAAFMKWVNKLKEPKSGTEKYKNTISAKGEKLFREEFEELYSFEPGLIEDIISDLKLGKFTENTKFHAFNELSDLQPVSMLEVPLPYVNNPNGRLAYTLKSFMIKQLDIQRRKGVKKIKQGKIIEGTYNMVGLAASMSLANLGTKTIKDFLKGRDFEPELLTDHAVEELLANYGLNKYTTDRLNTTGDLREFAKNYIIPPANLFEGGYRGYIETLKLSNQELGTEFGDINFQIQEPNFDKVYKELPIVGQIYYQWFGGGAEKYNEKQMEKVMKK